MIDVAVAGNYRLNGRIFLLNLGKYGFPSVALANSFAAYAPVRLAPVGAELVEFLCGQRNVLEKDYVVLALKRALSLGRPEKIIS